MTRLEFGRIKQGDVIYDMNLILYTVTDVEQIAGRTIKCVGVSTDRKIVSIDSSDYSRWSKAK